MQNCCEVYSFMVHVAQSLLTNMADYCTEDEMSCFDK